jgi:hypothetical protein
MPHLQVRYFSVGRRGLTTYQSDDGLDLLVVMADKYLQKAIVKVIDESGDML